MHSPRAGVLLSPTSFIYFHASQGGFSHSGAPGFSVCRLPLPSQGEAPGKAAPQTPVGASPPPPQQPRWGWGPPQSAPLGASRPGSPCPQPLASPQHLMRENPIFVFICQGVAQTNRHPNLRIWVPAGQSHESFGSPAGWRCRALAGCLARPAEIFSRHNLNFGESFEKKKKKKQRGGKQNPQKSPNLFLDPFDK